ncbi:MAG: NADH-quinone oxidoreductase subunit F [Gracilibacteraceae bacterium]|jgi:NADH-quinone oxidoreductase subunit F|nr:NADH-quinone oxidoreductase subunit F [Gracilibacteraceae bacterium]
MKKTILVCCGPGCIAYGGLDVAASFREKIASLNVNATVETVIKQSGCHGFCSRGPLVRIMPDDISYYRVKPKDTEEILHSLDKGPVERLLFHNVGGGNVRSQRETPFYASQKKLALRNVGEIDPGSISDYKARGGYEALRKALTMEPEDIIAEIEKSGLRGRGGAGFPTGLKWRIAAGYDNFPKYVIMNGDEGDPGAFMDRALMEGDPHGILEGIIICALAIGATEGYLYIRDEYTLSLKSMKEALADAEKGGFLGESILGSGRSLRLNVVRGGGAFVCGESSAMIESIEGSVGEPRAILAYPTERGLWDKPTVINNVETFINIPLIIRDGSAKFAATGTKTSKGTKVFSLAGKVRNSGLVEAPMGMTMRKIIFDIGGGIVGNRKFKAVQTGGPSGGALPESLLDLPIDFDTLVRYGSMMGSGGMIVMDDWTCMVAVAKYNIEFLAKESCGACVPCREGLRALTILLTKICDGRGEVRDLEIIRSICELLKQTSRCGLGKTAANPVLSTLKYFPEEYEEHIREKHCRAGVCSMGRNTEVKDDVDLADIAAMARAARKATFGETRENGPDGSAGGKKENDTHNKKSTNSTGAES